VKSSKQNGLGRRFTDELVLSGASGRDTNNASAVLTCCSKKRLTGEFVPNERLEASNLSVFRQSAALDASRSDFLNRCSTCLRQAVLHRHFFVSGTNDSDFAGQNRVLWPYCYHLSPCLQPVRFPTAKLFLNCRAYSRSMLSTRVSRPAVTIHGCRSEFENKASFVE
jgi:hypothetical protein